MIQILLKNTAGMITCTMTSLDELAEALNDSLVKSQRNLSDLLGYLMDKYYRAKINGSDYYLSNYSVGINQPVIVVFTELEKQNAKGDLKLILKDQLDNILFESEITFNQLATLMNDTQITQCTNTAMLELYLVTHHYITTINGESYRHKSYSVGMNHLPTFTFVKL
jgi:hypothetical protein